MAEIQGKLTDRNSIYLGTHLGDGHLNGVEFEICVTPKVGILVEFKGIPQGYARGVIFDAEQFVRRAAEIVGAQAPCAAGALAPEPDVAKEDTPAYGPRTVTLEVTLHVEDEAKLLAAAQATHDWRYGAGDGASPDTIGEAFQEIISFAALRPGELGPVDMMEAADLGVEIVGVCEIEPETARVKEDTPAYQPEPLAPVRLDCCTVGLVVLRGPDAIPVLVIGVVPAGAGYESRVVLLHQGSNQAIVAEGSEIVRMVGMWGRLCDGELSKAMGLARTMEQEAR
jgi:hypothetical protein